jgi:hypothetical protein
MKRENCGRSERYYFIDRKKNLSLYDGFHTSFAGCSVGKANMKARH